MEEELRVRLDEVGRLRGPMAGRGEEVRKQRVDAALGTRRGGAQEGRDSDGLGVPGLWSQQ